MALNQKHRIRILSGYSWEMNWTGQTRDVGRPIRRQLWNQDKGSLDQGGEQQQWAWRESRGFDIYYTGKIGNSW